MPKAQTRFGRLLKTATGDACLVHCQVRLYWAIELNKHRREWPNLIRLIDDIAVALGSPRLDTPFLQRLATRHVIFDFELADPCHYFVEFDELQHFTFERAVTLRMYPETIPLGFDRSMYAQLCEARGREAEAKGAAGYRAPKPPQFDFEGGRTAQRAFYDALKDLVPPHLGYRPTLRFTEFEVETAEKGVDLIRQRQRQRAVRA